MAQQITERIKYEYSYYEIWKICHHAVLTVPETKLVDLSTTETDLNLVFMSAIGVPIDYYERIGYL